MVSRFWKAGGNALLPGSNIFVVSAPAAATALDPASVGGSITFSNSNLTALTAGTSSGTRSVRAITAGAKIYFEAAQDVVNDQPCFAIINASASYTAAVWWVTNSANFAVICPAGNLARYNGATQAISGGGSGGARTGVAYDDTAKKLYTRINGVWQNSADPVAGTGGLDCTGLTGPLYAAFQGDGGDKATFNFGATAYVDAAPSGYGNI